MNTLRNRLFALLSGGFFLTALSASAAVVTATFNKADDIPVTAAGYTASGNTVNLTLNFIPEAGTTLTVVKNTALPFVQGAFSNLAQGQTVALVNKGITYNFVANYYGGTGNDLVLQWADTTAFAWGSNSGGQLGLGNTSLTYLPTAVTATGVLAGKNIVSVSAGPDFTVVLCADGTVATWGKNDESQLGNNNPNVDSNVPVNITTMGVLASKKVVAISAGSNHVLALCSDGTIASWGYNGNGQLGSGNWDIASVPVAVVTSGVLAGKQVVAVAAGSAFSAALCSDGNAVSWGTGGSGQLGLATAGTESNVPVNVYKGGTLASKSITSISAGNGHTLAICSDGTLVGWGYNGSGQTGTISTTGPRLISPLGALTGKTIVSVSAGYAHSLALCSDGTAAAWGANNFGQLGNDSHTDSSTPVAVSLTGALAGKKIATLAAGYNHSTAVCTDGTPLVWGTNGLRQMGILSVSSDEPLPTVLATSTIGGRRMATMPAGQGANHTLGLAALRPATSDSALASLVSGDIDLEPAFVAGTLNYAASVSPSTSSITLTPTVSNAAASVTVKGLTVASGTASQALPITSGVNAIPIAVTAVDGTTTTYTVNVLRQTSFTANYLSATDVPLSTAAFDATGLTANFTLNFTPTTGTDLTVVRNTGLRPIKGRFANLAQGAVLTLMDKDGRNYTFVADYFAGTGNDLVLRWQNTKLYAFGNNQSGQLGNNTVTNRNLAEPVITTGVLAGKTITALAAGTSHTLVLCSDGTLATWGDSTLGQLGNNTGGNGITSRVPVLVTTSGALAGKTVTAISAAGSNNLALCSDGTVVSWGSNSSGQLGNTTVPTSSYSKVPVAVSMTGALDGKSVVAISAGSSFSVALCSDGKVATWGLNSSGQLGNNSGIASTVPVAVNTAATLANRTVTSISAGSNFCLAQCSDGTVIAWGYGDSGQVGIGTTLDSRVPVIVRTASALPGKTVSSFSAGNSHSFALATDGTFAAWGSNLNGMFGNNTTTQSTSPIVIQPFTTLVGKTVTKLRALPSGGIALCSDASVSAWGSGSAGQLGNGANTSSNIPVAVSTSTLGVGEKPVEISGGGGGHVLLLAAMPPASALTGLTGLALDAVSLSPVFSPDTTTYTASVPNAVTSVTLIPTALNADVVVKVNGNPVVSGVAGAPIPLSTGTNNITILTTSLDGTATKTYTIAITRGIILNAVFSTATSVPLTSFGFNANSSVVNLSLTHAPATGTVLTVVNNTGPGFITGQFSNLSQYQTVNLTFGNATYQFIANYHGGTGNDLVLMWANNRLFTWGNNFHGELGNNSTINSPLPIAINTGPLAGKPLVRLANGSSHSLALCADGTLAAWGDTSYGMLGVPGSPTGRTPAATTLTGALAGKTIASISGGESFSAALCTDGTAATWGYNSSLQLGNGNSGTNSTAVPVPVIMSTTLGGRTFSALATGSAHTVALASDGTVFAWGGGNSGRLGTGSFDSSNTPLPVVTTGALAGKVVVAVAAGVSHSVALCSDGSVATWGANNYGQLGNNITMSNVPTAINSSGVLAGKTVTAIRAGGDHTLALCSDGTLVSWGSNAAGQLGNNGLTDSSVPVAVNTSGVLAGKTIQSLYAGSTYSMVLCTDGTLAAWGENYSGVFGNNTVDVGSRVPVRAVTGGFGNGTRVMAFSNGSLATHAMATVALPIHSVTTLAASSISGTGATLNGRVTPLGNSVNVSFEYGTDTSYGMTATGSPATVSGETATVTSAAIAGLSPGTLYHFRVVGSGPAGIVRGEDLTFTTLSDNAQMASLVLNPGLLTPAFDKNTTSYFTTLAFGTASFRSTPTTEHPGATITVNGTTANSGSLSSPVALPVGNTVIPIVVTAQDGIAKKTYSITVTRLPQALTFSSAASIPVTADRFSTGGQAANFILSYPPLPGTVLTVVNNTGLDFISGAFSSLVQGQRVTLAFNGVNYDFVANYYGGTGNDLVLQWADTRLAAWGANNYGQLGDDSTTLRPAPAAVTATGTLSGRTVTAVSGGYLHTLALCSDGTLASWGYNVFGQLGNNGSAASSVPVTVDRSGALAGKTVIAISAGPFHNLALCSDGSIAAWGYNNYGQLGTGNKVTRRAPALVSPVGALAGKQVVGIAAGAYQSFARCADGSVVAWGYNDEGELGDNTTASRLIPVAVDASGPLAGKKVASISAGQYHTLALCTDGTLVAWGYNDQGQLGNNTTNSNKSPVAINSFGTLAGKTVSAISAGGSHTLALCTDGTLAAWGSNNRSQLGLGAVSRSLVPAAVGKSGSLSGKTIIRIAAGGSHGMALCSDGTISAWGDNGSGQLGNNNNTTSEIPSAVDYTTLPAGSRCMLAATGAASLHGVTMVALPSPSAAQALAQSVDGSIYQPALADPDNDGIPNLIERAFALDPSKDSSGQLPQARRIGDNYVIEFTEPGNPAGILYGAESSNDLTPGSWREIEDTGSGAVHIFSIPATGGRPAFFRLKVSE